MWTLWTSKITYFFIQIYFGTVFLRQCIYFKFIMKESLKLTKRITWWYNNTALNSENVKFTNTLKNNMELGYEINGTKGTKHLQKNQTNIEHKTACLSQLTNRGRRCRCNRKNLFPYPYHYCLAKTINKFCNNITSNSKTALRYIHKSNP